MESRVKKSTGQILHHLLKDLPVVIKFLFCGKMKMILLY